MWRRKAPPIPRRRPMASLPPKENVMNSSHMDQPAREQNIQAFVDYFKSGTWPVSLGESVRCNPLSLEFLGYLLADECSYIF